MSAFADLVRFNPTAGGTTDWVYSSAVGGCQGPSAANVQNGVSYKVYAVSADLTQWEVSQGAYNSSTGTFPRTTVLYNSLGTGTAAGQTGAGTKINFSTVPQVAIVAIAEDLISVEVANSFTTAQQKQVRKNINVSAVGYLNILDFGGVGDGVTANDTAFANAYAALGTYGGCIYFPAGKYLFASQIAKTYPNAQFSVMLIGDGSNATTLFWPNASGGIQFTMSNQRNTFHFRDLTLSTSQVGSGNALYMNNTTVNNNGGQYWTSDIQNVTIVGDDLAISSTEYWAYCICLHNWPNVFISNVNTYGPHQSPGGAGGGVGLLIEGDATLGSYMTLVNAVGSSFNLHQYGVELGSYWQGITFDQCNWNGEVGSAGIFQALSATGVLALLTVTDSQLNYGGTQIYIGTSIIELTIMSNTITVYGNSGVGYIDSGVTGFLAHGNIVNNAGSFTSTIGFDTKAAGGSISGNFISNIGVGVELQSGSSGVTVALNSYSSVTTKVSNSGTGNSVGTAAAGNMTGVVP